MIDLTDLKITRCDEGLDYDDFVAQIEFEENSMSMDQSAFNSMMAEPGLISTDSLDMAAIRARCEASKDDYKLTFEDSGQWNSEIFGTNNTKGQTTTGQKFLINISEEDESLNHNISLKLLHQLNERWMTKDSTFQPQENSNAQRHEGMTWKSIGENLPNERTTTTSSLPELRKTNNNIKIQTNQSSDIFVPPSNIPPTGSAKKYPKLLAHWKQKQILNTQQGSSGELDDGCNNLPSSNRRYVDINENEIGYIPDNIDPIQRLSTDGSSKFSKNNEPSTSGTFDYISPSQTVPELKFISLSHKVPRISRPSVSLNNILKTNRNRGGSIDEIVESCIDEQIVIDELADDSTKFGSCNITSDPDSGLGTSNNFEGPVHIDDWSSLAILLPRNVVDACSFFKSNCSLLIGSVDNNIDRKIFKPVGRNISSLRCTPKSKQKCPMCFNHPEITTSEILLRELAPHSKQHDTESALNIHELSLIGLPFYDQKRTLVERVIEGVAELSRSSSMPMLLDGLESLLMDGLRNEFQTWDLIKQLTIPGPMTDGIYKKVQDIENIEKSAHKTRSFFHYLIRMKSVDGWFSYIILKKNIIDRFYTEDAFIRKANDVYRNLFRRLIEVLELLCLVVRNNTMKHKITPEIGTKSATSLPNDSRIPKSSSMPISRTYKIAAHKNTAEQSNGIFGMDSRTNYHSRIPIFYTARKCSVQRTSNSASGDSTTMKSTEFRIGRAKGEISDNDFLPLQQGEAVRILGVRDGVARCCRLHYRNGVIVNGKVPAELLDFRT